MGRSGFKGGDVMKKFWIGIRIKFFLWLYNLSTKQFDKTIDEWAGPREVRGKWASNSNIHTDSNSEIFTSVTQQK